MRIKREIIYSTVLIGILNKELEINR